jgi:hypothetical protein
MKRAMKSPVKESGPNLHRNRNMGIVLIAFLIVLAGVLETTQHSNLTVSGNVKLSTVGVPLRIDFTSTSGKN